DALMLEVAHRQADTVHEPSGDVHPRAVAELGVFGGRPEHAVPHVLLRCARPECRDWLLKQPGQPTEVPSPWSAQWRFKAGGVLPASDQVRIDVLISFALAEQVVQQPGDVITRLDDPADHIRRRTVSAACSTRATTSARRRITGSRPPSGASPEFSARAIWL